MASLSEEDFSCAVCHDIFEDPVVLLCSHSFCRSCLDTWWKKKQIKECPVCKQVSSMDHPPRNLALKKLCEAFTQDCTLHAETSQTNYRSRPVNEAARDFKKQIQKSLKTLLYKLNKSRSKCVQTAEHIKLQARDTKMKIKEQFKTLHQFLREEEEARITAVTKEEQWKSQLMKVKIEDLNTDISLSSNKMRDIQEQLLRAEHGAFPDGSFLQDCTAIVKKRFQLPDNKEDRGALIDVAKHLGNLTFSVWDKMKGIVSYCPVILDPNSALEPGFLSDDLTAVHESPEWPDMQVPKNPERMTMVNWVLGSEALISGYHSWDVDVGEDGGWSLGVLKAFYGRARGADGIWGICTVLERYGRPYLATYTHASTTDLEWTGIPRRIRVQLDCSAGKVWFTDLDTNTHILTYTEDFDGALFPFIYAENTVRMLPKLLPHLTLEK